MINTATRIKKIILLIGDIFIFYFSLWLTLLLRYSQMVGNERWNQHFMPFTLIFILWLTVFYITNLYDLNLAGSKVLFLTNFFKSILWCSALAVGFFYIFNAGIAPKTNLFLTILIVIILLIMWRFAFNKVIHTKISPSNTLILGASPVIFDLVKIINRKPMLGFKVVALTRDGQLPLPEENLPENLEIVDQPYSLKNIIINKNITTIITGFDIRQDNKLIAELYNCMEHKIALFDLPTFLEKFTGKIPVNSIGQIWFLENLNEESKSIYQFVKRLVDIVLSALLLILTAPFIPLLYISIKLDSSGPFLFKQKRTGKNNKTFTAMKIRSMYKNAEKNGPQWAIKHDNRVTRGGRFMRKTRIDEIPQLINILRGDMSFIGPRPERPEFIAKLAEKIPFYNQRHLIKPGLTGWAQINFPYGASEQDALEKLQYDLYYIKNRSFFLDLSILLKTIKTVLSGGGQ
ncbi:MAG: sugar transferase [Patescibacteria group bacterium]